MQSGNTKHSKTIHNLQNFLFNNFLYKKKVKEIVDLNKKIKKKEQKVKTFKIAEGDSIMMI